MLSLVTRRPLGRHALVRPFLALGAVLLGACGGDGGSVAGPARPMLSLAAASAAPLAIVQGTVSGLALPAAGLRARVGSDTAVVRRHDDSTLTLLVPAVAAGTQTVTVIVGADSLTTTLQVAAPVTVADPAAYNTAALDGVITAMDELEIAIPTVDAAAMDTAQLRADIRRARAMVDTARQRLAAASPEDRARLAQFLAANAEAFGLLPSSPAARSVVLLPPDGANGQEQSGIPKCFNSETGAGLYTWEECGAGQVLFSRYTRRKIAILTFGAAASAALDLSVLGTALGVVAGAIVVKELVKLGAAVVKTFAATTVARLEEQLDFGAVRMQVVTPAPDPEYFVKDRGRALRVRATYRSLQASDAALPGLGLRVTVARGLEELLNGVRSVLLLGPIRPLVPATARASRTDVVPTQYLQLGAVPSPITGTSTAADSGLVVRFARAGLTTDLPFTFELAYVAPGLPVQEREVPAVLIPTPRFLARSLARGSMGDAMCAYDGGGASYCWGHNLYGRLGDLTTTDRAVPTRLRTGASLQSLTLGDTHGCGLDAAGAAWCWGTGPLGDSTATRDYIERLSAGRVNFGLSYSTLVAGRGEVCGLRGGTAICWGRIVFAYDTAGRQYAWDHTYPNGVPGSPSYATLDVGDGFACGLTAAGGAYCFGYNNFAQLGDGTTAPRGRPVALAGGRTYASIAVGNVHGCALTTAGQAYCWGGNTFGQIGDAFASAGTGIGTTPVPTAVAGGRVFTQITAGAYHTCALDVDGRAWCWGDPAAIPYDDPNTFTSSPVLLPTSVRFRSLSAGAGVTCGITQTGGGVYCWGRNDFGEGGIGQRTDGGIGVSAVAPPVN